MDVSLAGPVPAVATDGCWLACIDCGNAITPFVESVYRCPDCGGLLEVRYADYPGWPAFESASHRTHPVAANGGVWRYEAALPPVEGVRLGAGSTPLYDCPELAADIGVNRLRVKHEGDNPTGSFKDRGMTVGVGVANRLGVDRLVCASTGNTSAALAAYGARAGLATLVVLPEGNVAAGKLAQASLHGARILEVDGNFDACLDIVGALAERGDAYLLNSLNPFRLEGQKTIGLELLEACRTDDGQLPDRIVLPVGNAGNLAALHKAFRELVAADALSAAQMPALTGVQASGAAPFVEAIQAGRGHVQRWDDVETHASAIRIGDPVNAPKALHAVRATGGTAVSVDDSAITRAQRELARTGIGVEPASAASLAGVRTLRDRDVIGEDEDVVCLTTGHLLKDPAAAANAGVDAESVPAEVDAVLHYLERN